MIGNYIIKSKNFFGGLTNKYTEHNFFVSFVVNISWNKKFCYRNIKRKKRVRNMVLTHELQ